MVLDPFLCWSKSMFPNEQALDNWQMICWFILNALSLGIITFLYKFKKTIFTYFIWWWEGVASFILWAELPRHSKFSCMIILCGKRVKVEFYNLFSFIFPFLFLRAILLSKCVCWVYIYILNDHFLVFPPKDSKELLSLFKLPIFFGEGTYDVK